ncbi:MAG: hypothetical protein J6J39_00395 [Clostridia bacterium]|nr:hypothetical protein [Clostridia bacterium]
MIKNISFKRNSIFVFSLLLAIFLIINMFFINSSAEKVVVEEVTDPDLQFAHIVSGNYWNSRYDFKQSGSKYTLSTNCRSAWEAADDIDFGYQKFNFNYGKTGKLTAQTTVESWNGSYVSASAGILLRSSLKPGAASVFLNARPEGIFLLYRFNDDVAYAKGQTYSVSLNKSYYPVQLKVELENNYVRASYKTAKDTTWKTFSSLTPCVIKTGEIYAGIAAHSSIENNYETAVFNGFSAVVEAEEGYENEAPDEPVEEEDDTLIVEDLPLTSDTILRETYSDNSVFEGEESVQNPIWETNVLIPEIITEERTNRYLHLTYLDRNAYYFAGNRSWTDYSLQMDLTFPKDIMELSENRFYIYTRMQDIAQYGYNSYVVELATLDPTFDTRRSVIRLGRISSQPKIIADSIDKNITWLATQELDYLKDLGTTNTIKIETLDNKITVYWNGNIIEGLTFTDEDASANLIGTIGIGGDDVSVNVDNILVRKLNDPLGGDYDNKIRGKYDDPIPDYIKQYADNKWKYSY